MTAPSAAEFLLGSGAKGKSASFPAIGASITGTITRPAEVKQQIDPDDNKPAVWDNGDPKWQIVVTLQTDQRNPEIVDDDGVRFLYVKGSKDPASQSMHAAVAGAVGAAGATELEVGGKLTVTYIADGVKPSPTRTAPKKYTATYVPAAAAALGVVQPTQQTAPVQAVQQQAPVQQIQSTQPAGDPELEALLAQLPAEQATAMRQVPGLNAVTLRAMLPHAFSQAG